MKAKLSNNQKKTDAAYATVAVFALVTLAVLLLFANARTLGALKGELQLLETRQEQRLENRTTRGYTNSAPTDVSLP